jgi:hypothetical protein
MYLAGFRCDGVDIWDCHSKQRVVSLPAEGLTSLTGHVGCSSDDGRMLAALGSNFPYGTGVGHQ